MDMHEDGQVSYARREGSWVLRFQGAIRYTTAHAVDRFLDDLFARNSPESISIDLQDATSIDSTGIGLLAKVANGLSQTGKAKPVLFSSNPEINEILTNLCLDDVCAIVPETPQDIAAEAIPATTPSEHELARTIAEAHRLLCELNDENRANFQSVVEAFANDPGTH